MSLMALYLFCIAFGAVLIGASLFLGGGDLDADVDADVDVDADADLDSEAHLDGDASAGAGFEWSVLPFGSLRFWTFLVEAFGVTGALLLLLGVAPLVTVLVSLAAGLGIGWAAFRLFRWLAREEVTGAVGLQDYVNQEARVLLPVRPGQPGKIVVQNMAGRHELLATTHDAAPIGVGGTVLIVAITDGRAEVTSLKDLQLGSQVASESEADRARRAAARTDVERQP